VVVESAATAVQQQHAARRCARARVAVHALVRAVVAPARQHVHRSLVVVQNYVYYVLHNKQILR
jgi:hypothetical protein